MSALAWCQINNDDDEEKADRHRHTKDRLRLMRQGRKTKYQL